MEAHEEALSRYGKPAIFNTDQGVQFTREAFTGALKSAEISISMDGKGCWVDNVFVERLWRSLKYEEVYLKAYENTREARADIRALTAKPRMRHISTISACQKRHDERNSNSADHT